MNIGIRVLSKNIKNITTSVAKKAKNKKKEINNK